MASYRFRKAAQIVMRYGMPIVDKMSRETHIIRGVDSSREVGRYCVENGYERPLIITDQGIIALGLLESTMDSLDEHSIPYRIFDQVAPDPTHGMIFAACKEGISFGADCIIAVGGGSVMDCAKVASIGIRNPHMPKKLLTTMQLGGWPKALPLITIPTTAGTGAEVTLGAVITDEKTQRKHFAGGPKAKPVCCILDAKLTVDCPRELTAITALDAISHSLEGLMGPVSMSKEFEHTLMEAVRKVFYNLPKVLENPKDIEARQELCEAANVGGHVINYCVAGYAHSFAHVLGARYEIPHGAAIAMALPLIMDYNRKASEKRLAKLSVYCGFADEKTSPQEAIDSLIQGVKDLIALCQITDYRDRLKLKDFHTLVPLIFKDSIQMIPPKVMNREECLLLLEKIRTNSN